VKGIRAALAAHSSVERTMTINERLAFNPHAQHVKAIRVTLFSPVPAPNR
jgi:hypothetical protein